MRAVVNESGEIGLIGTGLLGTAIAERLTGAGFDLLAHDRDVSCREPLGALGARWADDAGTVAEHCRRIVLCLPDSSAVAAVVDDLRPRLRDGDLIVDTTTGDPETTIELAGELQAIGVGWIDACVLGSSAELRSGAAMLLVGGEGEHVEATFDLLAALAADRRHLGPVGSGQRMKLVANLVLGSNRAALAEGLALAEAQGLDATTTLAVLADGPTHSRVMETKGRRMVEREFEPVARLRQHLKDVRLILQTAERHGARVPLSAAHLELLERAVALGLADRDNSAIIEALRAVPADDERHADDESE